jgi:hypothetical protein
MNPMYVLRRLSDHKLCVTALDLDAIRKMKADSLIAFQTRRNAELWTEYTYQVRCTIHEVAGDRWVAVLKEALADGLTYVVTAIPSADPDGQVLVGGLMLADVLAELEGESAEAEAGKE